METRQYRIAAIPGDAIGRSINDALRPRDRTLVNRSPEPHAVIINSRNARANEAGEVPS